MAEAETTEVLGNNQAKPVVSFAHESEREFAAILDYYQIRWEYEPRAFPLRWDADGNPIESFTPDFYLVDQNLFVELTTLKQRLVTKKNRKLRMLRALYPDVKIKLFYSRDVKSLLAKYGLRGNTEYRIENTEADATRGSGEAANGRMGEWAEERGSDDVASRHDNAPVSPRRRRTHSPSRRLAHSGGRGDGR